jgi:hypothetical protein
MSPAALARDSDLSRLLDDGYDVAIQGNHLIVRHIPYVDPQREVAYGFLAYPVAVSGDRIVSQTDHRIWFGGAHPHTATGVPLPMANPEVRDIAEGVRATFMLSSKPTPEGYPDEYSKVTSYVRIISHEAMTLDPAVTATPGGAWTDLDDDSPFVYRDTASSRAGLQVVARCFTGQRVTIIGLGGTGSYILDQVAKTPVAGITLIDGDHFENHNAFRAPGAASLQDLRARPMKVTYYRDIYARMHTGITAHPTFLDEDNLILLDGSTFVFLASDDPLGKPLIIDWLEQHGIAFIDVGLGMEEVDGHLTGLLHVITSKPGHRDHVRGRIPTGAPGGDDYGRNIQIADLNALNAQLAVIRWKRHLGFYADLTGDGFSTYSVSTNELCNEDRG